MFEEQRIFYHLSSRLILIAVMTRVLLFFMTVMKKQKIQHENIFLNPHTHTHTHTRGGMNS